MKRLGFWVLIALLLWGTGESSASGATSESGIPTTQIAQSMQAGRQYQLLVGLPIQKAQRIAAQEGVHLTILRVPSTKKVGVVINQDPNLQMDQIVVVSDGPLKDRFQVLPPAKTRPVHAECAGGLILDEDGNVGPLICHGGVNVGAWTNLHGFPVMKLGRSSSKAEVIRAICAPIPGTDPQADSAYQLASNYYGWHFGEQLFMDYVYGLHGKGCSHLK